MNTKIVEMKMSTYDIEEKNCVRYAWDFCVEVNIYVDNDLFDEYRVHLWLSKENNS